MKRIIAPTKDVTVPSGYTVTLKAKKSYGDGIEIRNKALGNLPVTADAITTVEQANEAVLQTLLVMITAWDVTEEDDSPTPLTEQNIKDVFSDEDVQFLADAINGAAEPDPKS